MQRIQRSQTCNRAPAGIPTCASVTYLQNVQDGSEIYHIVHKVVHREDGKIVLDLKLLIINLLMSWWESNKLRSVLFLIFVNRVVGYWN